MTGMSSRASGLLAVVLAVATLRTSAQAPTGPRYADVVIRGGKVVTVDASDRIASAVAILGDRIAAVGDAPEMNSWIGPATTVVELHGRTLLPGFIDAHSHVMGLAESEHLKVPIQVPTPRTDVAAIMAALKQKQRAVGAGTWIFGQGTYYQPMPTREQLDEVFP